MVSRTTRTVLCFSSTVGLPTSMGRGPSGATASTMTRNRSRASPGSRGIASLLSSTCLEIGRHGTTHQMAPIKAADLDTALEKDQNNHDRFDHS
jgi:hypothetical protein